MNYYNEWDKPTAAWLTQLIKEGCVPPGDVDTRSITEVKPDDLRNYTQCHFFAGVGGWSQALDIAGWGRERPVWTGSPPCQPFSGAQNGEELGVNDPRHLWPFFFRLIAEHHPDDVYGEQVDDAIRHGWLDGISADLEAEGYAVGAHVLGAHSVGSPQQRQRILWVAQSGPYGALARNGQVSLGPGKIRKIQSPLPLGRSGRLGAWDSHGEVRGISGKRYRISPEPGAFPLVDGISERMGAHMGYGNAIVPQVGAAFIQAAEEARCDLGGVVSLGRNYGDSVSGEEMEIL